MKKTIGLGLLICNILVLPAQQTDRNCRLGFSYEFSSNAHWGKDRPVIMKVYPKSPAELAGILQNDVIEQINGLNVKDLSPDDVDSLLTASESLEIELTVSNFSNAARRVPLTKECYSSLALNESQLAEAFAMYSVERTHNRLFICPFVTTTTEDSIDFSRFTSFDFTVSEDSANAKIEKTLNETLKAELTAKGLQYNTLKPDFLVHTYYIYRENPNFRRKSKETEAQAPVFRYDITRDRVTKFPFYPSSTPESEAEYLLQLGVRFIDRRFIPGRVLWECEANELMSAPFAINEYALIHIPLMCMQFPYVKYSRNAQFILTKKAYHYTGLSYNINRLNEIAAVDPVSPAWEAGIRPRDLVEQIENKRMDHTAAEFTAAYHRFITHTLKFRDKGTRFTDANGFTDCMYWDPARATQIAKAFNDDKRYLTAFSYLYGFEPHLNRSGNTSCTFVIRRDGEKRQFTLRPIFYSEKTIELN
ncbi:MAG: DUF4136 domain-containing protein [Tannerella sp.]|nr:DUF4136 domain-containing protein [Tannerella sp.]